MSFKFACCLLIGNRLPELFEQAIAKQRRIVEVSIHGLRTMFNEFRVDGGSLAFERKGKCSPSPETHRFCVGLHIAAMDDLLISPAIGAVDCSLATGASQP
jgi:hypothetical protein